jgi:hypothetical protein
MASRPSIPERYSSRVPQSDRKDLEILSERSASVTTQLSTASSTDDFINAKIESIKADLALNRKFRGFFSDPKKRKAFTDAEYKDAISELKSEDDRKERELIILKRQKKTVSDDIEEGLPHYSTIEDAYSSVLMTKIMSASGKQRKAKLFDQSAYSKAVLEFYSAERCRGGTIEKYCHLFGWLPEKQVKCVDLVPKSLESDELAYLLGVREVLLSEPRNGMFTSPSLLLSIFLILG